LTVSESITFWDWDKWSKNL